MKRQRRRILFACIGIFCVFLVDILVKPLFADEPTARIVIIGNKSIPTSSLSKVDVQNIFLGKKTKVGGGKITFVVLKEGEVHESFLKEYLSRTPAQYKKYWKKLIFTGKGKAPKSFDTEEALVEHIKNTEGAIGYVGTAMAEGIGNDGLQQFTVQ